MPLEKGCRVSVPKTLGGSGGRDPVLLRAREARVGQGREQTSHHCLPALSCFAPSSSSRAQGASRLGLALPRTTHLPLPLSAPQPVCCLLLQEPSNAGLCPDEGWTPSLMATLYAQCSEEISAEELPGRGDALGLGLGLGWGWGAQCASLLIPSRRCTPVPPRLLEVDVPETM